MRKELKRERGWKRTGKSQRMAVLWRDLVDACTMQL
jgi:hypothetical protein